MWTVERYNKRFGNELNIFWRVLIQKHPVLINFRKAKIRIYGVVFCFPGFEKKNQKAMINPGC